MILLVDIRNVYKCLRIISRENPKESFYFVTFHHNLFSFSKMKRNLRYLYNVNEKTKQKIPNVTSNKCKLNWYNSEVFSVPMKLHN
ncbi:unnamed protein product [Schistosoma mattheei]|uniref:Uncharacterized protein n=1 Tax=Schistosoma mattheei TaxID=31246 RepID=A0AA85C0Q4_9TREM|nr:unnamed protein product [Schistosoma mattheei]